MLLENRDRQVKTYLELRTFVHHNVVIIAGGTILGQRVCGRLHLFLECFESLQ